MIVNMNGKLTPREKAVVSVFDHGLLYGDGVFEGIRAYNGRVFRLPEHIKRLYDSAKALLINIPITPQAMSRELLRTLAANHQRDAYIRLVITRGPGDLGLGPENCDAPTWFIITDAIKLYPEKFYQLGLSIATVSTRRNANEALSPKIKSLNYLNNIMAKIEAQQRGCPEAILLTQDGYVAECTGDNLFVLRDGRLLTPPTSLGCLAGITRQAVLDLARKLRIPAAEEAFTRYDVFTADEAFLSGTAAEVVPVVLVDGRPVGSGKPGPVTQRLRKAFQTLARSQGTPISKR
jgi:branched-chain amino acid aminotransferase